MSPFSPFRRLQPLLLIPLALAAIVSFGQVSEAQTVPLRYIEETQALTRAAPTLATEGVSLARVTAYRITVCAPAGQTLTGGSVVPWVYQDRMSTPEWAKGDPSLALTVPASAPARCQIFKDIQVFVPFHRVLFATSAVTLSGTGTDVTVRIDAAVR